MRITTSRNNFEPTNGSFTAIALAAFCALLYFGGGLGTATADSDRSTDPLISDVDWLNDIVLRYERAGGWFGERDSAQLIISRLSYAGGDYGMPLTGNSSGVRLVPVLATQPPAGKRWAYWNVITNRFDLWRGPAPEGVEIITHFKRRMDGRARTAQTTGHAATPTEQVITQSAVAVGSHTANTPPSTPPAGPLATTLSQNRTTPAPSFAQAWGSGSDTPAGKQLQAPRFDPPGGQFPPDAFTLPVRLSNPNADRVGTVYYSIDNSGWTPYRGEALLVGAGSEILAFCETANRSAQRDSEPVAALYTIDPIRLELSVDSPAASLPASALGFATPPSPLLPQVAIANIDALPDALRTGGHFQILWTLDGSDPLTSPTAFPVEATAGGTGKAQPLPLSTLLTGDATELRIRIAARSTDRRLLLDSEETELHLQITRQP